MVFAIVTGLVAAPGIAQAAEPSPALGEALAAPHDLGWNATSAPSSDAPVLRKINQTLSVSKRTFTIPVQLVGDYVQVSGAKTSPLTVTTSHKNLYATVTGKSGNIVRFHAGAAFKNQTITITAPATSTYNSASVTLTVTADPGSAASTIFPAWKLSTYSVSLTRGGSKGTVSITGGPSACDYYVSSSNAAVATASVSGKTVTINPVGAGSATLTVTQDRWIDGGRSSKSISVSVSKATSTITLSPTSLSLQLGGGSKSVSVGGVGDGIVTAESSKTSVASVTKSGDGKTLYVYPVGVGQATITVKRGATANYNSASKTFTVTVADKPSSSVRLSPSSLSLKVGGAAGKVTVTVTGNGALTVSPTSATAASASISGNTITVTPKAQGKATFTVTKAETTTYKAASATLTVNVAAADKKASSVTLSPSSLSLKVGGAAGKVTVSGTGDGALSVSPASATAASASVSGNTITVTPRAQGTATFTVTRAATATYNSASATLSVSVGAADKKASSVTLSPSSLSLKVGGAAGKVTVSGTGDGALTVSPSSATAASASVSGNTITVTPRAQGTATFTVTRAETSTYLPSSAQLEVRVESGGKKTSTVEFYNGFTPPTELKVGSGIGFGVGGEGDGKLSVESSNSSVLSATMVSEGFLNIYAWSAGTSTVTLTRAETDTYSAATRSFTVNVVEGAKLSAEPESLMFSRPGMTAYSPASSTVTVTYAGCTVDTPLVSGLEITKISDSNGTATFRVEPSTYVFQDTDLTITFTGRVTDSSETLTDTVDVTLMGYQGSSTGGVRGTDIAYGYDNFCFVNGAWEFFKEISPGYYLNRGYELNDYYKRILKNNVSEDDYAIIESSILNEPTWGGSCWGMSQVLAHFKNGALDQDFFQQDARCTYDLRRPADSETTRDLVNFYHCLQQTDYLYALRSTSGYTSGNRLVDWRYQPIELRNRLLINNLKTTKSPIMICIQIERRSGGMLGGGGHALIAYDYVENSDSYQVFICDPNDNYEHDTLVVKKDFSESHFLEGSPYNYYNDYNNWCRAEFKSSFPIDSNVDNYCNLETILKSMGRKNVYALEATSLQLPEDELHLRTNYDSFVITGTDGTSAVVEDGQVKSGDFPISRAEYFNEPGEEVDADFIVSGYSDGTGLEVRPMSALPESGRYLTGFHHRGGEDRFLATAEAPVEGTFALQAGGFIATELAEPSEQTIKYVVNDATTPWDTVTATAATSSLAMGAPAQGVTDISADSAVTATVTVSNGLNEATVSGTGSEFTLAEGANDEAVLNFDGAEKTVVLGHTVTFHTGCAVIVDPQSDIAPGGRAVRPADPVREGYTFDGWYTEADGGSPFDFGTPIYEDTDVYAHWSEGGSGGGDSPDPGGTVEMLRLYNPWTGEHLFTDSRAEYDARGSEGWTREGRAWTAPAHSSTPVYRLYNPNNGDHHYTTSLAEYNRLDAGGWDGEWIAFYSDDAKTVPVYRLFNGYVSAGTHHYTRDKGEYDSLPSNGWKQEGIGWYGLS